MSDITCPVSAQRVDENSTRIGAFLVIVIAVVALYTGIYWLSILLAVDFAIRAFTNEGKFSPIKQLAKLLANQLSVPKKPIDAAPKKFAAGVGFAFAISIAVAQFFLFTKTAYAIGSVLLVCAVLESFFAYCVGCIVFTFLVLPLLKQKINAE